VIPLDALREMFGYNYWARDAQLEACEALTPEQFLRPMGNSFSSVRDTLAHLVAVEWIWCSRWRGKSPGKSESEAYAADKFPTLESVRQKWCDVELDVRDFLTNISEFELERDVSYTNLAGKHFTFPLPRVMWHLVNHQTYHRGQIATLLRQLGVPAPKVDYLHMLDGGSKK